MIVIGANGFAKEVLGVLHQLDQLDNLCFFDDVSELKSNILYDQFPIYTTVKEVSEHFRTIDNRFILGLGNPKLRKKLSDKFIALGGELYSTISPKSYIAPFNVEIGQGVNIITGSLIDNSVKIKEGALINTNVTLGHDCKIGSYVEICPGVVISGNCEVGDYTFIGSNATILPKIKIGSNVIIAAGSVILSDVKDNSMVAGNPAVLKKNII